MRKVCVTGSPRLSERLWDTYEHPASSADSDDLAEVGRREDERDSFALVFPALYLPNLPDDAGVLEVSGVAIEDEAHALGRVLGVIADHELTDAVVAEAGREMRAVERAGRGELTGRSAQAVVLDRLDASPAQVAVADRLLWTDPLGPAELLTSVTSAAACVAAAHWLAAAASIASETSGVTVVRLLCPYRFRSAPVTVAALAAHAVLACHLSPYLVVDQLLRQGVAAKEGRLPAVGSGAGAPVHRQRELPPDLPAELPAGRGPHRTTPLDPMRPARDLLEHLLDGIRSCLVAVAEHADQPAASVGDDVRGATGTQSPDPILEQFVIAVRLAAAARRDKLM